jgi:opacity protein-like surface antigen
LESFLLYNNIIGNSPDLSLRAENIYGYHVSAGPETIIKNNWPLSVDFKYLWSDINYESLSMGLAYSRKWDIRGVNVGFNLYIFLMRKDERVEK